MSSLLLIKMIGLLLVVFIIKIPFISGVYYIKVLLFMDNISFIFALLVFLMVGLFLFSY
jgi:hypothetical protein